METTQYNQIAKQYESNTHSSYFEKLLVPNFINMIGGDVTGKKILDLACGEGLFTRLLKQRGAAKVVGVDISHKLIETGREKEAKNPLQIEYITLDVLNMPLLDQFDIATASFLLNYASSKQDLLRMVQNIRANLILGGKFIGFTNAVTSTEPCKTWSYGDYRVKYVCPEKPVDGDKVEMEVGIGSDSLLVTQYYISPETYEWVFKTNNNNKQSNILTDIVLQKTSRKKITLH